MNQIFKRCLFLLIIILGLLVLIFVLNENLPSKAVRLSPGERYVIVTLMEPYPVKPSVISHLRLQGVDLFGQAGPGKYYSKISGIPSSSFIESVSPINRDDKFEFPPEEIDAEAVLRDDTDPGNIKCELDIEFIDDTPHNRQRLVNLGLDSVKQWNTESETFYSVLVPNCDTPTLVLKMNQIADIENVIRITVGKWGLPGMDNIAEITRYGELHQGLIPPALVSLHGEGQYLGVWDLGKADRDHPDFQDGNGESRIIYGDSSSLFENMIAQYAQDHPTIVMGPLVGDGYAAGGTYVGAADKAWGLAYNVLFAQSEILRASQPAGSDDETYGMTVASNSWHYLGPDSLIQSESGDNREWNEVALNSNAPIVFAAGNSANCVGAMCELNELGDVECNRFGNLPDGSDYYCLYNPSDAKNVITVGATKGVYGEGIADFSSRGPTRDGRIKPDISSPGLYITTTSSWYPPYIYGVFGTSISTPTVAGIIALLKQHYGSIEVSKVYGIENFPVYYKGILIHTATDIENPGPDYKSGWGSVNPVGGVEFMNLDIEREDRFSEYNYGSLRCYGLTMPDQIVGDLKVTLAWADVVAEPREPTCTDPPDCEFEVQNDLDLTIRDGSVQNVLAYPYVLDPYNPEEDAETGVNFRDNIEQAIVPFSYLEQYVPPGETFFACVEFRNVVDANQDFTIFLGDGDYGLSCGDGEMNPFYEECDETDPTNPFGSKTCQDYEDQYYPLQLSPQGYLSCERTCKIDVSTCFAPNCGDGNLDSDEVCDPTVPDSYCFSQGTGEVCSECYPQEAGALACQPMCETTSDCSYFGSDFICLHHQGNGVCVKSPSGDFISRGGGGGLNVDNECEENVLQGSQISGDHIWWKFYTVCENEQHQIGGSCKEGGTVGKCTLRQSGGGLGGFGLVVKECVCE